MKNLAVLLAVFCLLVLGCAGGSKEMLDEDFKKMNNEQLLEYFYRLNDEIEKQEKQTGPSFGIGVGGIGLNVLQGLRLSDALPIIAVDTSVFPTAASFLHPGLFRKR